MTRKRFVKLCMGVLGMSRNEANRAARDRNGLMGRLRSAQIRAVLYWREYRARMRDEIH